MSSWSAILQQAPFIKHKAMCFLQQITSLVPWCGTALAVFCEAFLIYSNTAFVFTGILGKVQKQSKTKTNKQAKNMGKIAISESCKWSHTDADSRTAVLTSTALFYSWCSLLKWTLFLQAFWVFRWKAQLSQLAPVVLFCVYTRIPMSRIYLWAPCPLPLSVPRFHGTQSNGAPRRTGKSWKSVCVLPAPLSSSVLIPLLV